MRFEWDPAKELVNRQKHQVSFAEASTVFADPLSMTIPDRAHSEGEARFLTIGRSSANHLLVVAHAEVPGGLRIISARSTTANERRRYESEI